MAGRFEELWSRVQKEFPRAKIIPKSQSLLIKTLFWVVKNILRQKTDYNAGFVTTIATRMYVPDSFSTWPDGEKYRLLRHEVMHMRQSMYWPIRFLGRVPILRVVNTFLWGFCYLFVLPAKITLRARFEKEGYAQTMLTNVELGRLDPQNMSHVANWMRKMEKIFSTGIYFYMARPTEGAQFAAKTLKDIDEGRLRNDRDRVDIDKVA